MKWLVIVVLALLQFGCTNSKTKKLIAERSLMMCSGIGFTKISQRRAMLAEINSQIKKKGMKENFSSLNEVYDFNKDTYDQSWSTIQKETGKKPFENKEEMEAFNKYLTGVGEDVIEKMLKSVAGVFQSNAKEYWKDCEKASMKILNGCKEHLEDENKMKDCSEKYTKDLIDLSMKYSAFTKKFMELSQKK